MPSSPKFAALALLWALAAVLLVPALSENIRRSRRHLSAPTPPSHPFYAHHLVLHTPSHSPSARRHVRELVETTADEKGRRLTFEYDATHAADIVFVSVDEAEGLTQVEGRHIDEEGANDGKGEM